MRWIVVAVLGVLLVGASGVLVVGSLGTNPFDNGRSYERPPCDQLPTRAEVEQALAANQDVVTELLAVGPNVKVEVAFPCEDRPDRGVIEIRYQGQAEWDGIQDIMTRSGFGTAVDVVED